MFLIRDKFKKEKAIKSEYGKTKYAIEMHDITKTFNNGAIIANDQLNLKVKTNTIHAIVGENGAGKSTLMSILFGIYQPDSGEIKVNEHVIKFNSAQDASYAGLGMVHQHFKLVHVFSLLENIILGAEVTNRFGFLNMKKAHAKVTELAHKYNLPINLNKTVEQASVGEQQRVEILKLLYRDANILIFDEPTAVLSDAEIESFLDMLLEFKKLGKTIILITHKLNEVKKIADHATVIRLGKNVGEFDIQKTSTDHIANTMVGHELNVQANNMLDYVANEQPVILQIEDLHIQHIANHKVEALRGISLEVHAGEILGVAGVEGNGQSELAMAIGGLIKPTSGVIRLIKHEQLNQQFTINNLSIREIYELGISHVPEDRHKYGLLLDETVAFNCAASQISKRPFSRFGFLNKPVINNYAANLCKKFDIRGAHNGTNIARNLSGGNQQKLVFAREISRPHKLIIYVQPTRGLDLGAIQEIHKHITADAKNGAAVILISYELDEIFNIASNIIVMSRGEIVYRGRTVDTTRKMIGHHISRHDTKIGERA
jgi:simple sugar transport system ATP-binding protein